jgi:hypothetical protein
VWLQLLVEGLDVATKDEVVRIRCEADEKARWVEAAGGERKLSAWLRNLANLEAHPVPPRPNEPLLHEPVVEATQEALLGPPQMPTLLSSHPEGFPEKVSIGGKNGVTVPCARARFHRPGTYCASCKKTA